MNYDVIVAGGGLGGAALADQVARSGRSVLVLERETKFKDRVRGENMLAWGVAAAKRLGLYDDLITAGGHDAPNWCQYVMGQPVPVRDLRATTPGGDAMLNIFHPALQEAVMARCIASGADVRRGATVLGVDTGPNQSPSVTFTVGSKTDTLTSRILVGADGRASQMRAWCGFETRQDHELLTVAGTLLDGTSVPEGAAFFCMGPGIATFWAPLGNKKSRTYFIYPGVAGRRGFSGKNKVAEFLQAVRSVGIPDAWLDGAQAVGPLAEFDGADRYVDSPAKNGVALVGDAAGSSDPSWGCGLSLTLLDVEALANALRETDDWSKALSEYARRHDEHWGAIHRIHEWMYQLIWSGGPEADARRARVFPRWAADPRGFPDAVGLGPFGPSDDNARRLVLGLG
jgi:2-polyprenyl-6-methoxyphenol hydroxylase-like FAD-dependent oxidoreductase